MYGSLPEALGATPTVEWLLQLFYDMIMLQNQVMEYIVLLHIPVVVEILNSLTGFDLFIVQSPVEWDHASDNVANCRATT